MEQIVETYLHELWSNMQDDHPTYVVKFAGALELAVRVGLLSSQEHELWKFRIQQCPDPAHVDGRLWCAYCGDTKKNLTE